MLCWEAPCGCETSSCGTFMPPAPLPRNLQQSCALTAVWRRGTAPRWPSLSASRCGRMVAAVGGEGVAGVACSRLLLSTQCVPLGPPPAAHHPSLHPLPLQLAKLRRKAASNVPLPTPRIFEHSLRAHAAAAAEADGLAQDTVASPPPLQSVYGSRQADISEWLPAALCRAATALPVAAWRHAAPAGGPTCLPLLPPLTLTPCLAHMSPAAARVRQRRGRSGGLP